MRTNPKQKVITINKSKCDKQNLYATINLNALHLAAQDLKAGAFKLWTYFAQNQNNYSFALSNKDANDSFGIKKDQYDTAMKELADKGYLRLDHGNNWIFSDIPNLEVGKTHNENLEVVKTHNENNDFDVVKTHNEDFEVVKNHNPMWEKTTTGSGKKPQEILQDNTYIDNTETRLLQEKKEKGSLTDPIPVTANELEELGINFSDLVSVANGLFQYKGIYLKPVRENFSF